MSIKIKSSYLSSRRARQSQIKETKKTEQVGDLEDKLLRYNSEKIPLTEKVKWKDLQLGDIIIVQRGEVIPADLLILESQGGRITVDCSMIKGTFDEILKKPTSVTSGKFVIFVLPISYKNIS